MRALRQIHAQLLKSTSSQQGFAFTKIVGFCALSPSGDIDYARRVFAQISVPNTFSYNSMIRGTSQMPNPSKEPISLYQRMLQTGLAIPNSFTLAFVLKACAVVMAAREGPQIHSHVFKYQLDSSPFVQTALLNFYSKCEEISVARQVFDEITGKNIIMWSAMINGYARIGLVNEALELFREMQKTEIIPDEVTMVSVISACAKAGALDLGRWVHKFIEKNKINIDLELSTALVDMYSKCGSIERARCVFNNMVDRDTKAWSSMIVGLANHGLAEDALELFNRMEEAQVKPNQVTFIGVLSACAHRGLVSEGQKFWSRLNEFGIEPSMEHYGCMTDLLCRASLVEEAYDLVQTMPLSPNAIIWRTLLGGFMKKKIVDKGERVAERLLDVEPSNAENYVLISNFYASILQWEKVSHTRKKMKENGVKTLPGCSSIEVDGFVHEFVMGNESHPETKEIREVLVDINLRVQQTGHVPCTSVVLHDVGEEEKAVALCEHSERLAIAYGLLKTKAPVVIRVVKNLRVCRDCHEVTKIISNLYDREIVVRDRIRFHRFHDGICSCKDYW